MKPAAGMKLKPVEALNRLVELGSNYCVSQAFFTACCCNRAQLVATNPESAKNSEGPATLEKTIATLAQASQKLTLSSGLYLL